MNSSSCCDVCFGATLDTINAPTVLGDKMSRFYASTGSEEGQLCTGHRVWAWPVNALLNIVCIALSPLVALVNLIAAAIFGAFSCCSETCKIMARAFLFRSINALSGALWNSIARIAVPSFCSRYDNACTRGLIECLLEVKPPPPPPPPPEHTVISQQVATVITELRKCMAIIIPSNEGLNNERLAELAKQFRQWVQVMLLYAHGDQLIQAILGKLQTTSPKLSEQDLNEAFQWFSEADNGEHWAYATQLPQALQGIKPFNLGEIIVDFPFDRNPCYVLLETVDDSRFGLDRLQDPSWVLEIS